MRSHRSYPFLYAPLRSAISTAAIAALMAGCAGPGSDALPLRLEAIATPAAAGSGEPFLSVDGAHVYMSWLEASAEGGHDLRMARYKDEGWANASTIAHSDRFFVNWADFPSITRSADGALWAHWLERGAEGGYDYGVRIARSDDGGASWGAPWTPHDDESPTEHGFVSTVTDAETIGFSWLDGRSYADGPDGEPATQEMSLRYRAVGMDGTVGPEVLLDDRVCDCCQTASAMTDLGPVVVYRDRTAEEIRDIYIVRRIDGVWGDGAPVYDDGWNIAGCPVNGPAVAARGQRVAVAWFAAPGDVARVKVAFSDDAGATFSEPTVVDDGNPAGRVDLVLEGRRLGPGQLVRTNGRGRGCGAVAPSPGRRLGEFQRIDHQFVLRARQRIPSDGRNGRRRHAGCLDGCDGRIGPGPGGPHRPERRLAVMRIDTMNDRMKMGIALLGLAALTACVPLENAGPPEIDRPAREYAAATLAGDTVTLESMRGSVVLLNLWATWCTPCRMETPYLQSIYEEYKDQGFEIVGISMDTGDAADDVAMFVDEYAVTYTILHDPEMRGMELYQVLGLPATFLIDREGVLRWMRYGPIPEDDPNFLSALEDVL